jgi:hypothetical protein
MRINVSSRSAVRLTLLLCAVVLIYPFGPFIFSSCWRLIEGDAIHQPGMRVAIPTGWFGRTKGESILLTRITPGRIPFTFQFESVDFRLLRPKEGATLEPSVQWESEQSMIDLLGQDVVSEKKTVTLGGLSATCHEIEGAHNLRALCLVQGRVLVFFWGRSSYQLLGGIRLDQ